MQTRFFIVDRTPSAVPQEQEHCVSRAKYLLARAIYLGARATCLVETRDSCPLRFGVDCNAIKQQWLIRAQLIAADAVN